MQPSAIISRVLLLLLVMAVRPLTGQAANDQFDESYLTEHLSEAHPRLILTPALEAELTAKIQTDTLTKAYYDQLRTEAYRLLDTPLIKYELEGFRLLFVAREMGRRMSILSMVYRQERDPVILARINEELLAACAFPDWNPQHFLDIAELSVGVATAVDWVGEDLPAATVTAAKNALINKALLPSFDLSNERMGWIEGTNNWNTVCHGGLVLAALAVADDEPALATKTIRRALDKMPNSLAEYGPDGNYPEGPSYWEYGTVFGVLAMNALTTALGSDFGLSATTGFLESAGFRLIATAPSGLYFNYSDSGSKEGSSGAILLTWFAGKTGDAQYLKPNYLVMPKVAQTRYGGQGLVWLSQFQETKRGKQPRIWRGRGSTPVVVMQAEHTDPRQLYFAAKGGRTQTSHGNMDIGTFVFELDGVRWVTDPGNQRYYLLNKIGFQLGRYCQECERWSLLTKSNLTHSTLTVNNERFDVTGFAPISEVTTGDRPSATIDLSALNPGLLSTARRQFTKESDHGMLLTDEFVATDSARFVTWAIITTADVIPRAGGAELRQDGKVLELTIVEPAGYNVSISQLDPPPLAIDKTIPGLKRVEIRVPAHTLTDGRGRISVRLAGPPTKI
ncbi:heparinase II/III domain-containing protein [Neolewinella antarctica]|uniref:Heparinase II/III-like C-terminal domain-containing protein n=1 Tax=Neolewinella antarctica TaxID=442734 RepID=A0ABX0XI71_9BACT|nr:heparinase II/III family protein [Neolewinella antarctica]NJC28458.1 hypothetical protein [Neolewinella antarctica]